MSTGYRKLAGTLLCLHDSATVTYPISPLKSAPLPSRQLDSSNLKGAHQRNILPVHRERSSTGGGEGGGQPSNVLAQNDAARFYPVQKFASGDFERPTRADPD